MKRVLISIILCIPVYAGEIFAQIEGYENIYIDDFRYGLFVPPDYNPDVGHHLMLYLHGALFLDDVDLPWYQPEFQEKYPTIVITPKCSPNLDDDGKGWGNSDAMEETFCTAMAFRAVDSVLKYYNIDTTKMHVGGHSMGAYGTFYILASRPGLFASAVALSGGGNAAVANLIKETPLWIFHGSEDNVVATSSSRAIFQAIRNAGGKLVRYTEYPGKGHQIWAEFISERTFDDWMFSHQLGAEHDAPEESVGNFQGRLDGLNNPEFSWAVPDSIPDVGQYTWAFQIYRDSALVATLDRDSIRFTDLDAEPFSSYKYSIAPMNYFFQEGPLSQEITIVTGEDPAPPQLSLEKDTVAQGEGIRVSIDRNGTICLHRPPFANVDTLNTVYEIANSSTSIKCMDALADSVISFSTDDLASKSYWLYSYDQDGLVAGPISVYVSTSTAVSEVTSKSIEINLTPNPVHDVMTVSTNASEGYDLVITSLNGQILHMERMESSPHQINLSSFRKGIYFITVRSRDYVRTEKIIKQ